jgi:hypothetical protein
MKITTFNNCIGEKIRIELNIAYSKPIIKEDNTKIAFFVAINVTILFSNLAASISVLFYKKALKSGKH